MQYWEVLKLFKNLESLDLTQHRQSVIGVYEAGFDHLTALTRLKSLKVERDHNLQLLLKVCHYISH